MKPVKQNKLKIIDWWIGGKFYIDKMERSDQTIIYGKCPAHTIEKSTWFIVKAY